MPRNPGRLALWPFGFGSETGHLGKGRDDNAAASKAAFTMFLSLTFCFLIFLSCSLLLCLGNVHRNTPKALQECDIDSAIDPLLCVLIVRPFYILYFIYLSYDYFVFTFILPSLYAVLRSPSSVLVV